MRSIVPVILSGGAGTRLWPLSRSRSPKQFLPLVEGRSTFAMTLERVADRRLFARPLIVAASAHRFLIGEALRSAGTEADVLLEPVPRDTAAAVATAASVVAQRDPNALLMVLAADHLILDTAGFVAAVETARAAAEADYIVTFGIVPDRAATSYGYVGRGEPVPGAPAVSRVAVFREKPAAATAEKLVADGYLWNSGNFMMPAAVAIGETERHSPDIARAVAASLNEVAIDAHSIRPPEDAYRRIPATSFDYAVMEKTDRAAVVEARFDWRDLGTWESLSQIASANEDGNASVGDVVTHESRGCYVHAGRGQVALIGVDDLVVAVGEDAVLVAKSDRIDAIRGVVAGLDRPDAETDGNIAYKVSPWGYFQSVEEGDGYKVKRLVVEPGARLSLQRHKHRAEHWVVVAGVAEVTVGDTIQRLETNQSTFIRQGEMHRLANPGDELLTVIEVQYGDYLGEDDIERFADDYNR